MHTNDDRRKADAVWEADSAALRRALRRAEKQRDDILMLAVRSMNAVDRAVEHYNRVRDGSAAADDIAELLREEAA